MGGICNSGKEVGTLAPVGWADTVSRKKGEGQRRALPGNSVREVGERIKGGAVRAERSPETAAMLVI